MESSATEFTVLLQRARQGDAAARDRVLAAALPQIQAYVRLNATGLVMAREWSLDVAQSVCANALEGLPGFSGGSEAEFRSWLCTIALNKIRMRHRYHTAQRRDARREQALEADGSDSDDVRLATIYATVATPSVDASAKESIRRLEEAMTQLTDEQRNVLTMATVLGLSHAEIAAQLGKQEPAVRKTLARARARLSLRLAMGGDGAD